MGRKISKEELQALLAGADDEQPAKSSNVGGTLIAVIGGLLIICLGASFFTGELKTTDGAVNNLNKVLWGTPTKGGK